MANFAVRLSSLEMLLGKDLLTNIFSSLFLILADFNIVDIRNYMFKRRLHFIPRYLRATVAVPNPRQNKKKKTKQLDIHYRQCTYEHTYNSTSFFFPYSWIRITIDLYVKSRVCRFRWQKSKTFTKNYRRVNLQPSTRTLNVQGFYLFRTNTWIWRIYGSVVTNNLFY